MALKVIGAGMGRTGTLSLKNALEILGNSKCYHLNELLLDPSRLSLWEELQSSGSTDFASLFEGYYATTDAPGCLFVAELHKAFPEAKVILSVRDPESWYESALETIYRGTPITWRQKLSVGLRGSLNSEFRRKLPVLSFAGTLMWKEYFEGRFLDKAFAMERYQAHNEFVKSLIPSEQLLIFQSKEGWEPLCSFLGKPMPSVPYPFNNQREPFLEMVEKFMKGGEISMDT